MSKVTVSVVTVLADLPAGVAANVLKRFSILDATGAVLQTQDVADVTAVFTAVADGSYIASVQDLDGDMGNLGDAVTAPFTASTVVVPPAQFAKSSTISVVVSPD